MHPPLPARLATDPGGASRLSAACISPGQVSTQHGAVWVGRAVSFFPVVPTLQEQTMDSIIIIIILIIHVPIIIIIIVIIIFYIIKLTGELEKLRLRIIIKYELLVGREREREIFMKISNNIYHTFSVDIMFNWERLYLSINNRKSSKEKTLLSLF